jgi:hypothetical protein
MQRCLLDRAEIYMYNIISDEDGNTVLHIIATTNTADNDNNSMIEALVDLGVDIN